MYDMCIYFSNCFKSKFKKQLAYMEKLSLDQTQTNWALSYHYHNRVISYGFSPLESKK